MNFLLPLYFHTCLSIPSGGGEEGGTPVSGAWSFPWGGELPQSLVPATFQERGKGKRGLPQSLVPGPFLGEDVP